MKTNIQDLLTRLIQASCTKLGFDLPVEGLILDFPDDDRFGDLSTNIALRLAKPLKRAPRQVAELILDKLKDELAASGEPALFKEIKVEGAGFINFYLAESFFHSFLRELSKAGEKALRGSIGQGKSVLIEFVSANPTGPLSVAHARQAAVGDILARILDFCGYRVQREYYLNDKGNQINILGRSIELRLKELNGEKVVFPEDHYQGEYIKEIASGIKEKGLEIKDFPEYGADYILAIIRDELKDFGVEFDSWFSQKKLEAGGQIEKILAELKDKGFVYEEGGAIWFKSTAFGDDKDRVVIKSDGSYTYLAPDIAYHQDKYRRGFNWMINLWGPDHHGYINRLKASVQAFGHDASSLSIVIVQLATIFRDGKPVQMSTRKGQYITLREVLDEVGRDAARFFFIMRKTDSHLDFDLEVAKKQTSENPVYYVQYAHARISGVLRQAKESGDGREAADFTLLKEPEELRLAKKLWQFPYLLNACARTVDPYMLTVYLQELAETFHKFYDAHRVLGQEPALTSARLGLLSAVRTVISCGLGLAGVSSPEKM